MLMDGNVSSAALVQPRRIQDVTAVLGLVVGVCKQNVGQLVASVLQHVANIALALIVEEAVGCRVYIAQVLGTEGLNQIASLVVELAEVIRMRLNLNTQAFALDNRQQLFHRTEPHAIADFLLVRIAGELGVDNRYAHVYCDLDDLLPVCNSVLTLLLGRAAPAVYYDEGRDLYAGLLESLAILCLTFLGEQRVLVERVDARMRRLLDVLVAPISYLMYHGVDVVLLRKNVNVKSNFHVVFPPLKFLGVPPVRGGFPVVAPIIPYGRPVSQ